MGFEDQPYKAVDPSVVTASNFSWAGLIGTTIFFLLVLLILFIVVRSVRKTSLGVNGAKWVKVLDRQLLGGSQVLYLVEVAGKLQVLGGTEHSLTKIAEIDDPEIAAEILEELAARQFIEVENGLSFILNRILSLNGKKTFTDEFGQVMREAEDEEDQS